MKIHHLKITFFYFLFLISITQINATNYYLSSTNGSDNNSLIQAQNQSTPWKTISKLNEMMDKMKPGDVVMFKKGDTFSGIIKPNVSGTTTNNIVFTSFGKGKQKPIIEGFTILENWKKTSENIWEAVCLGSNCQPAALLLNNVLQPLGRYPNIDTPNGGYLTIDSHPTDSKNEFTCNSLTQSTDWLGSEVVLRTDHWILDRILLAKQNGTTLTLAKNATYKLKDKTGFFFQNHPSTLDINGEWCYVSSSNKVVLYSTENPNKSTIKVATHKNCFFIERQSNISIVDLKIMGSRKCDVRLNNVKNIKITNCDFEFSGQNSISHGDYDNLNCENIIIENNTFTNVQSDCLEVFGKEISIKNNNFKNIGIVPGMAESGQKSNVINTISDKIVVERNTMDQIGYSGIMFGWSSNVLIKENVISNFCKVLDDGSGIYCWSRDTVPIAVNRKIINNIVLNGLGAPQGTGDNYSAPAEGIYLDDNAMNVEVLGNTISNCTNTGIYIHNGRSNTIKNNTVIGCDKAIWIKNDIIGKITKNCIIQNNTLISNDITGMKPLLSIRTKDHSELEKIGVIDKNIYCQPYNTDNVVKYSMSTPEKQSKSFNLRQWREFSKYDQTSLLSESKFAVSQYENMVKFGEFNTDIVGWSKWCKAENSIDIQLANGKLNGNCLSVKVSGDEGLNAGSISTKILPVISGKTYKLKMKVQGLNNAQLNCFIATNTSPFKVGTDYMPVNISSSLTEKVVLFKVNESSESPRLNIAAGVEANTFFIDDVELNELKSTTNNDETKVNSTPVIRFEYNTNTVAKVITLDKNYISPAGLSYNAGTKMEIPAFGSVVLLTK